MTIRWQPSLGVIVCLATAAYVTAQDKPHEPTITLEQTLHFLSEDAGDVVVQPGTYSIEPTKDSKLRLVRKDAPAAIVVQTVETTHDERLSAAVALVIPSDEDTVHIVLLTPDNKALDAAGSPSGARPRATAIGPVTQVQIKQAFTAKVPGEVRIAGAPPAPILLSPAEGTAINGPTVSFTWQAGRGSPAPTSYKVCVTPEGQPCTSPLAWNHPGLGQPTLTGTTLQRDLPASLYQGKLLSWTVAACAPNPSLPVLGGGTAVSCTYAPPRPLSWLLPPPRLHQAEDNVILSGFRPPLGILRAVPGADSYLFCISKPGIACPTTNTSNPNTVVVRVSGGLISWMPGQDLTQFAGLTVHWTAAACNALFGCVYQQAVRALTFPPALVPLHIRNRSQFDVNEVWLVRGGGPGTPLSEKCSHAIFLDTRFTAQRLAPTS